MVTAQVERQRFERGHRRARVHGRIGKGSPYTFEDVRSIEASRRVARRGSPVYDLGHARFIARDAPARLRGRRVRPRGGPRVQESIDRRRDGARATKSTPAERRWLSISSRGRHQQSNAAKVIQNGLRLSPSSVDAGTSRRPRVDAQRHRLPRHADGAGRAVSVSALRPGLGRVSRRRRVPDLAQHQSFAQSFKRTTPTLQKSSKTGFASRTIRPSKYPRGGVSESGRSRRCLVDALEAPAGVPAAAPTSA